MRPEDLKSAALEDPAPDSLYFELGDHRFRGPASHYDAVPPGASLVLLGSLGYLEIAVNGGSAAGEFGLRKGMRIEVGRG